ncbi:non-structural maintenance of chromosomes element 1 homolog [Anthonomus grandis grandis]|uniref:non-structural maintenance of chromosomes element 1 homolog n=1 Tax=Anthonomus grandis grandis TaxID=2921223 RepID=UPI00216545B2|nr:non-structural maintenance of chromosomes element 1 homolog [Anthonomus grandis grandis]
MEMQLPHRHFVQYMLQKGAVPQEQAVEYCKNLPGGSVRDLTQLRVLILTINRHISAQFFKISNVTCEVTNRDTLVWTNLKDDSIAKCAKTFKPIELEYFNVLLQQLANNEDHHLKYAASLNMTSTLTSAYSLSKGEAILSKWIEQGFFILQDGLIYLGPRTIVEFGSSFKSHGYECCNLCSELVFIGKTCSACHRTLHSYCLLKYLANQDSCPCCKNPWAEHTSEDLFGTNHHDLRNVEDAVMSDDSSGSPRASTSAQY